MTSDIKSAWNEFLDSMRATEAKTPNELHRATDEELVGWNDALDMRENTAYSRIPLQTREDVIRAVRRTNPIKYGQIMRDYKWLQKQMKKLGLNPEDARYLF